MHDYNIFEDYESPMPGEGPFFTDYLWKLQEAYPDKNYGLASLDWQPTTYTLVNASRVRLTDLFNKRFAFREIGQETPERWQHMLQVKLDSILPRFEHMYKVYTENDVDTLGKGYDYDETRDEKTTFDGTIQNNTESDAKFADTPLFTESSSSIINNPTTQNVNSETGSSTESQDATKDTTVKIKKVEHDEHMIDEINQLADRWRTIENEFLDSFEECFIGIFITGVI